MAECLAVHPRVVPQIGSRSIRRSCANAWTVPFDTPLQMLFYTVFQERATQLIYLNLGRIAMGQHPDPGFAKDKDPALVDAISAIAIDEAAHFDFFLSVARLYHYYFPEASLKALVDVLRSFTMPAAKIIPNYEAFIKVLYVAQVFGPRMYGRDVAKPALAALGIDTIKAVEAGIQATRDVPDQQGAVQINPVFAGCAFSVVESAVHRLFDWIGRYEQQVGLSTVDCTTFVPYTWF